MRNTVIKSKRNLVIGLDIGTTSVKAVLFDIKGKQIAEAEELIKTYYPHSNWVEQSPVEIEAACLQVMKHVVKKVNTDHDILLTTGISCAMHSLICMNENFEPLDNMLIWSDGRSSEQAKTYLTSDEGRDIFKRTGTPFHAMTPFMKLIWMKENNFEAYNKATYFATMKEYLLHKWFGKRVVDFSMASSTGLMNIKQLDWDEKVLEIAGVKREQLSEIVPPTTILTGMVPEVTEEIGLPSDHPFVIGGADGQMANLGSGATSAGEVNISVGTSGAIRQFVQGSPINEDMETFTYAFSKDFSIIGGATNNGGITLQWFKDLIEFDGTHAELIKTSENIPPGAEGIIFIPYVNGERAPIWNQAATGTFFGLNVRQKKEHLARAVLEGIAFNLYQIGQSLEKIAGKPEKVSVNGGLSQSRIWVQILADIFGMDIHISETHHNAAWGAAWTALMGIGHAGSYHDIKENMPTEKVITTNKDNHEKYASLFEKYKNISNDLSRYF